MLHNYTISIGNQPVELSEQSSVRLSYAPASLPQPTKDAAPIATITLPSTPVNDAILLYSNQLHSATRFNSAPHPIRIESDGALLALGIARLDSYSAAGSGNEYRISIIDDALLHLQTIDNQPFNELFPEFQMLLTGETIAQSWTADSTLVRYLPVARALYLPDYSTVSLLPPDQPMTSANYHPFLHLTSIIERIFNRIGYSVRSEFMHDKLFNSLYISGLFPEKSIAHLIARMDFRAGRFTPVSATANAEGQIFANPTTTYNSIGNLVETASPTEQQGGKTVSGMYDVGGCISIDNQRIRFTPKHPVTVAMRYQLSLTTAYQIVSRTKLRGFGKVNFGNNDTHDFGLSNPFTDRRNKVQSNTQYRVVVFEATSTEQFRLIANLSSNGSQVVIGSFTGTSAAATTPSATFTNLLLQKLNTATQQYSDCTYDWALYDGFVEYQGVTDVELDIWGKPEELSPSSPKYFDATFSGAWNGAKLTLRDAVITPIFEPHPTENSLIHWGDIAAHRFSCLKLLDAVNQMFNLCYQFDEKTHQVYIEPRDEYYQNNELDYSSKIELTKSLTVEPPVGLGSNTVRLGYRSGDGATRLINRDLATEFGTWAVENEDCFAKHIAHTTRNVIFTPSISYDRRIESAPSAQLIMCGDVSDELNSRLNFLPKIVVYQGVKQLPTGEHWGYPTYGTSYPYAAFHSPGEWTLCMENRDGCAGLNRFWFNELERQKEARRMTAYLNLAGFEIERFREPGEMMPNWRTRFRFTIDGEWSWWLITKIEDYSPDTGLAKCSFVQCLN